MSDAKLVPKLRFEEFSGDWSEKLLESLAKRGSGHTPNKKHKNYYNGEIKWVSLADSNKLDNGFIEETTYKISAEGIKNSSAVLHKKGSVLLSRDAGIGKSAVMKTQMAVSQHFIVWLPFNGILYNWFLYYVFQINKTEFERIAIGSTIKTIGLPYFKKLKIKVPKFEEQQKIATFLTAVDKKIALLQQKKSLLEQYKKGVMQQIFIQELRFKDDDGNDYPNWKKRMLGEVFFSEKGNGISKGELDSNGKFVCILYGELYTTYSELIHTVKSKTDSRKGLLSRVNDLLIPSSTTTTGIDLANVTALNFDSIKLGGDIIVLRSNKKVNNIFYAYYLSNFKKHQIASRGQGITIVHLYFNSIKDLKIDLPSLDEQTKIANFLSVIDSKIALVNTQLQNTQQFKKGLLQQLFV